MVWDETYVFSISKPQQLAIEEWNIYCDNIKETGRKVTKRDEEEYSKTHLDSILVFTGHSSKVIPNYDYIAIYYDGYYIEALYDCFEIPEITVVDLFDSKKAIPEATIMCHIINALMHVEGSYDGPMLTQETGKTLAQFALDMFDFDVTVFGDERGAEHEKARSEQRTQNNRINENEEKDTKPKNQNNKTNKNEEMDDYLPF